MNPQGADSCSSCGTRLTTTATSPSDKTTPADMPENITPFTPPEMQADAEPETPRDAAPSARPTFGRASSSEWLKRLKKTSDSPTDASPPPSPSTVSSAASSPSNVPEWLRDLQAEANQQAAVAPHEISVDAEKAEPVAPQTVTTPPPPSAPTKPQLSEIKLTGDDYDYSDIGGEVTDEMKAQLEAQASNVQSVDDEIALARKLLGLEIETPAPSAEPIAQIETAAPSIEPIAQIETPAPSIEPIAQIETAAPTKPQLSEIKLTGDDYDYSDIGGEVTDEMKAQLEAHASSVQSVDDEIALARKLLGLDIESEVSAPKVAEPVARVEPPQEAAAPTERQELPEWLTALAAASSAAVAATADSHAGAQEIQETVSEAPHIAETVAEIPSAEVAPVEISPAEISQPRVEAIAELPRVEQAETEISERAPIETSPLAEMEMPRAEMIPAETPQAELAPPVVPALESGELPEWLRELAPQTAEDETIAPTEAEGEIPEWVKELTPGTAIGASSLLTRLPELADHERDDLPDWLREPIPAPAAEPTSETVSESQAPPYEAPLELPDWFSDAAMAGAPTRDPYETVETTGPLAGVSGILPLAVAITEPHALATPTPMRSDGGRIFQTLLAEPLAPSTSVRAETKPRALVTPQHILYLLIFLAALIPLFLPLDQAGLGLDAPKSNSAAFYDRLQSVPQNGTVLLAFDYSPGQTVELDPAARAIVDALMARRANVIAVSSNPNGATLAQTVLQRAQETHSNFVFVNVGYIPGNEAGLRELASGWLRADRLDVNGTAWGASPLAQQVRGMDDLALAVILVGEDSNLRVWMEQVQPRVQTPLIAATTAALEPQARNYVNAKQLQASLRGLTGAAELELLTNTAGQAVKTVDALSFVSLLLAGIIIAANMMMLMRRKK